MNNAFAGLQTVACERGRNAVHGDVQVGVVDAVLVVHQRAVRRALCCVLAHPFGQGGEGSMAWSWSGGGWHFSRIVGHERG